jgi:hypothetical protein
MKSDWKKDEKKYYLPKTTPTEIVVPAFNFFSLKGKGNPNDDFFGEYISVLYSLSYAIKMYPKSNPKPECFVDYSVYPLEGIWDISEEAKAKNISQFDKNDLVFDLMIRQPDFVTNEFALEIIEKTKKKKPHALLEKVVFSNIEEGKCLQMMHFGSYDSEPASFDIMSKYCEANSLTRETKQHREIYLSDARRVAPEKLKTVLRIKLRDI